MSEPRKQTVLVTGSSGCLGQHVVRLLHENDDTVGEIRCYDLKPYQNNLRKCSVELSDKWQFVGVSKWRSEKRACLSPAISRAIDLGNYQLLVSPSVELIVIFVFSVVTRA